MSCMSTVGFGNIASNTLLEKFFAICMMIISALLYAAIFGHMTTIIQQMTASTVRYAFWDIKTSPTREELVHVLVQVPRNDDQRPRVHQTPRSAA